MDGIDRIAQLKLPVADLARSVDFYRRLLDLRLWTEIAEDGVVRGAALIDAGKRFNIALRERAYCASSPDLRGFDVVAFVPAERAVLDAVAARCAELGFAHGALVETPGGTYLDVPDPDGTVLRFYHFTAPTDGFTGIEMRDGAVVGTYAEPRLS